MSSLEMSPLERWLRELKYLPHDSRPGAVANKLADRLARQGFGRVTSGGQQSHAFVTVDGFPMELPHREMLVPSIKFPCEQGLIALRESARDPLAQYTVQVAPELLDAPTKAILPPWQGWTVVKFEHQLLQPEERNAGAILLALERHAIWLMKALRRAELSSRTFVVPRGLDASPLYVTFNTNGQIQVSLDPVPPEQCCFMATFPTSRFTRSFT